MRVRAEGSNFEFYINGVLVLSGTDTSLVSGQVGLGMYSNPSSADNELLIDWAALAGGFDDQFSTCSLNELSGWLFHSGQWLLDGCHFIYLPLVQNNR